MDYIDINERRKAYLEGCCRAVEATAKRHLTAEEMMAQALRNHGAALRMHNYVIMEYDGVVTSEKRTRQLLKEGRPVVNGHCPVLDPDCVASLETILASDKDAVIILLSRKPKSSYYGPYKTGWRRQSGSRDVFHYVEVDNCGDKGKGKTLSFWMQDFGLSDKKYVILCPQNEFLDDQQAHFIQTSPETGLTPEDAQRAIKILKGE